MEDLVLNHLKLDPENYIVKIFHDDDEERLQTEHSQRVERWISSGKYVSEESKYSQEFMTIPLYNLTKIVIMMYKNLI